MPTMMMDRQTCDNCGEDFDLHYGGMSQDCGCCYTCESCYNGYDSSDNDDYDDDRGGPVRAWNYRPDPYMPKGNYPEEALLGLELEVGGRHHNIVSAVHTVDDDENHLYMKEDGSISGVEIVTHPMTLEFAHEFPFADLIQQLNWNSAYVDDGYGVHVHVSRAAFRRNGKRSPSHAMAWLMFMYRNSNEVQSIARRTNSRWASFRNPQPGELKYKGTSERDDVYGDRYVAVNCNNAKTYELRFFASTLNVVELYAALEFADASVEYTRQVSTADVLRGTGLSWNHFARFVHERSERYANLAIEIDRLAPDTGVDENIVKQKPVMRNTGLLLTVALRRAGHGGRITRDDGRTVFDVMLRDDDSFRMRNHDRHCAFGDDWYTTEFFLIRGWSVVA